MAGKFINMVDVTCLRMYMIVAMCCAVTAAPPEQQRYPQHAPAQLQQINPINYYLDNQGVDNYYRGAEQKQVNANGQNLPSRLETLEPDSEVELVPGVQPQQPPQQNPVAPNVPGLLPGQRVFIVHMPVPGYRPGSVGGYQPVYIVAAGAQGNQGYPGNGFQNAVLLDPSGHGVVSPFQFGYQRGLVAPQLGFGYNRPYDLVYQDPRLTGQPAQGDGRAPVGFAQNIGVQGPVNPILYQIPANQAQAQIRPADDTPAQLKQNPEGQNGEDKSNRRTEAINRNKA